MSKIIKSLRYDRLTTAKSYALYYGYGRTEELSIFDLAIIEPKGMTEGEITTLKNWNTLVIMYISFMEVHSYEPIFSELEDHDFLLVNGKRLRNEEFGTYIVDLRSQKWVDFLLKEIDHRIVNLGADGIFIDTIGDIELASIPAQLKEAQTLAVINILYAIKLLYSNHLIIQNNGLESLCLQTAPFIDGICWENPPITLEGSYEWVDKIMNTLSFLKSKHNLKVFLLLEETIEQSRKAYKVAQKVAKEREYLLYLAPGNYVNGVSIKR